MAKKPTEPEEAGLVWVTLKEAHDLPGQRLRPGRVKVSSALRDVLQAAGKLAEE